MSTIVQVRPLGSYRIWLRFSDGAQGEVDLSDLAGRPRCFCAVDRP